MDAGGGRLRTRTMESCPATGQPSWEVIYCSPCEVDVSFLLLTSWVFALGVLYVDALQPRRIRERRVFWKGVCSPAEAGRGPPSDRRRRTLLTQETQPEDYCTNLPARPAQMQASRRGPLCGPPVGEWIPFWDSHRPGGRRCTAPSPPMYGMTLMISVMQMQVQMQVQMPTDHAGTSAAI